MKFRAVKAIVGALISGPVFVLGIMSLSPTKTMASKQTGPDSGAVIRLGKQLFFDRSLSNPEGMACATCHSPEVGYSYPESETNLKMGPVPGAVPGRFGNRRPPMAAYATYLPTGLPHYDNTVGAYVGGLFWDGRAGNAQHQAQAPFLNPNEMNDVLHNVGSPEAVVRKVKYGPSGDMFRQVYGQSVFNYSTQVIYNLITKSIAAFEASPEVSPFTSKYDAWLEGKAKLTADELAGLRMVTGHFNGQLSGPPNKYNAHCVECHGITANPAIGPDLWTNSCYANLGVPRNPNNPYYKMTDPRINPIGYNALGSRYIDYGLGDFLYPYYGLPAADLAQGDPLAIDGTFKAPSLRNVDKRPSSSFIKCYMHNGAFKTLKQVVHFYNTRNLTTYPGEVIDFTKPNPYAGLKGKPLWPRPEWPSPVSMINPQGFPNKEILGQPPGNEQIGNMLMADDMENQIVAFLKCLTDGYFERN